MDISSYLLTQGAGNISAIVNQIAESEEGKSVKAEEFEKLLTEEAEKLTDTSAKTTRLTEMQALLDSLDQSILGGVKESLDRGELADEMLSNPEESTDVVKQLMSGHMQSIVMTDSDDKEDAKDSLTASSTETLMGGDTATETLAQNLETIMESIGQNVAE